MTSRKKINPTTIQDDESWMMLALDQAQKAAQRGEVPVGAVLIDEQQQFIASGHNQPILGHDPTAHAEIVALRAAAQIKQNYRLTGTTLYVTLEPCAMCVGAMIHARIKRLVYAADEHKTGAIHSTCKLLESGQFNHTIEVTSGVLDQPCADILSRFFSERRAQKKQLRNKREL